jgi:hypothetical protein
MRAALRCGNSIVAMSVPDSMSSVAKEQVRDISIGSAPCHWLLWHISQNGAQQAAPLSGSPLLVVRSALALTPRSIWRDMTKSAGMIASR